MMTKRRKLNFLRRPRLPLQQPLGVRERRPLDVPPPPKHQPQPQPPRHLHPIIVGTMPQALTILTRYTHQKKLSRYLLLRPQNTIMLRFMHHLRLQQLRNLSHDQPVHFTMVSIRLLRPPQHGIHPTVLPAPPHPPPPLRPQPQSLHPRPKLQRALSFSVTISQHPPLPIHQHPQTPHRIRAVCPRNPPAIQSLTSTLIGLRLPPRVRIILKILRSTLRRLRPNHAFRTI